MPTNPNVAKLASSIVADPRYADLKIAAYEAVTNHEYVDPSNAFGNYMGNIRLFQNLEAWAKDVKPSKLKEPKTPEQITTSPEYIDEDLK